MVLSWHVEYWDRLGWKDPFASKAWTDRQKACAKALMGKQLYTPQMVVGRLHGSSVAQVVAEAKRLAKEEPELELTVTGAARESRIVVTATMKGLKAGIPVATRIFAAIAEDGLVTKPTSGENAGVELREGSVVRALGEGKALADGTLTWEFAADAKWNASSLRVAAFVQDPATWAVYGAAQARVQGEKK